MKHVVASFSLRFFVGILAAVLNCGRSSSGQMKYSGPSLTHPFRFTADKFESSLSALFCKIDLKQTVSCYSGLHKCLHFILVSQDLLWILFS